ncbi:MAG: tRNA dihydrouridine synthase [Phycisphaerales bacterium]
MSCNGNNATPPGPAIAPGVEGIDVRAAALEIGRSHGGVGVDPRLPRLVPGFDAPMFQAGLAGYSDAAMRIVARRHGAPMCVTEALLDRMLLGGGRGFDKADIALQHEQLIIENMPCGHEDHPLTGQIIGSDPDEMAASALKMIEQGARRDRDYRDMAYGEGALPGYVDTRWQSPEGTEDQEGTKAQRHTGTQSMANGQPLQPSALRASVPLCLPSSFSVIDVNLACPVKKIDRKARGGHWLTEPTGAIDILRAVRAAVPAAIPCSVKLRRAYDDTPEMARNFEIIFAAAYELGYAWTTVHARTVEQKYIGPSRWDFLRALVHRNPGVLVFGSGDVWEAADVIRMVAYTGVAAVSVARGAIGNPWIFRQVRELLAGREALPPTLEEQRGVLHQHFALSVALHGERAAGKMMRKFGIKFAQHHPRADEVKAAMIGVNRTSDWLAVLTAHYPTAEGAPAAQAAVAEEAARVFAA